MDSAGIRNVNSVILLLLSCLLLRDFLLQYNKISESCFLNCVNHLSERSLSQDESGCVDMCTKKFISVNHKVMQVYLEIQPLLINKRIQEVNKQQSDVEEVHKDKIEENKLSKISNVENSKEPYVEESKKLKNDRLARNLPNKEIITSEYQ